MERTSSDCCSAEWIYVAGRSRGRVADKTRETYKKVEDIACLKCGRRSRLLPIHLAQDGRQIELPPKSQDQRVLAAFFSFLPSFLPIPYPRTTPTTASPVVVTSFFSLLSAPVSPGPSDRLSNNPPSTIGSRNGNPMGEQRNRE